MKVTSSNNRVLFIHPPANIDLTIQKGLKYPPMGIAFLCAFVRKHGYSPRVFDANVSNRPFQELQQILKEFKPGVVGISFTSILIESAHRTAEIVKKTDADIKVIAGGYHTTVMAEGVIKDRNFDIAVVGEGEYTLLELLERYRKGEEDSQPVKGVVFRKGEQVVETERRDLISNIDFLPMPAYDLLNIAKYSSMVSTRKPYVTFIRSRGCPFQCIFCGVNSMFGHKYRCQSPEKTIGEIEKLIRCFHIREILFKDSDFLIDKSNVKELCHLLIERKFDLVWSCNARVDMVDDDILALMKEAGCKMITYGVESGNDKVLKRIKKGFGVEQSRKAIGMTKKAGIQATVNIMFGNPEETREAVGDTIDFLKRTNPDFMNASYLTAFPGSALYDEALAKNWFIDKKKLYSCSEKLTLNASNMTDEELSGVLKDAIRNFYLRPKFIWARIKRLGLSELKNNVKGLWAIVKSLNA